MYKRQQLDRLVAEAIKRFDLAGVDPAADPEDGYLHVDPRHVTIHDDDVHFAGTMRLEAELDIADALDLGRALAHGAATLKALGSDAPLGARRSAALGDLARTQTALDLHTTGANPAAAEGRPQPGPTETGNLAALCRSHHRLKTHTAWRYRMVAPGVFEWVSPHGHRYRRDRTGTSRVDQADGPPDPPAAPVIPHARRP